MIVNEDDIKVLAWMTVGQHFADSQDQVRRCEAIYNFHLDQLGLNEDKYFYYLACQLDCAESIQSDFRNVSDLALAAAVLKLSTRADHQARMEKVFARFLQDRGWSEENFREQVDIEIDNISRVIQITRPDITLPPLANPKTKALDR